MKLLIVVDYQIDFVNGSLGFEGAELLDERIAEKIDEYRSAGNKIVFTFDTHEKDYLNTQEGKNLPIAHCLEGSEGHKLFGQTASKLQSEDKVFYKPSFGSAELFDWLRAQNENFESIELAGLVSNICVISNVILAKTACPETPVIVDARCTASFDASLNEKVLDVLEGLQVEVVNR